jgi:hypothetical protein
MKYILTLIVILFLFSCRKKENQERENFAFAGIITDCYTNAPIKNASVHIVVKHLNNGGFFMWTKDGGTTYTDDNGYYYIKPIKHDFFTDVEIYFSKDGYLSETNYIDADSINENGGDLFLFNHKLSEPGVVKVILNNNAPYDSTDRIFLRVASSLRCENSAPGYSATVVGNGINEQVEGEIGGNDSVYITYRVKRNGITSAESEISRFCPARDTTTVVINY